MPHSPPSSAQDTGAAGVPAGAGEPWGRGLAVTRERIVAVFFFAAFLFLLYQLYRVFSPFLGPIVWAVVLALLFYPLYLRALALVRGRQTLAALLLTLLVWGTILVPTVSLSSVVTREAALLYAQLTEFVRSGRLNATLEELRGSAAGRLLARLSRAGLEIDYAQLLQRTADTASTQLTALARNVATFLFDFTLMLFTLFFLFRDGDRMYRTLRDVIPLDPAHKDAIFYRLYETLSAVMRGMFATACAQGVLTWIGLWILALPYAAFFGVLAGVVSLVPLLGAAAVWMPCTVYFAVVGELVRAGILLLYGAFVISMVDNFLRPLLIGGQTRLPTLFLFFGMLGGVDAYGFLGLFLGPVLVAVVFVFARIYREQYVTTEPAPLPPSPG